MEQLEKLVWVFGLLFLWETIWKSIALWKSARNGQKGWYIAIFLLNTIGLLPIIYLQFFQKKVKTK